MFNASRYTFALLALMVALTVLVLLKNIWNVPKELLIFAAVTWGFSFLMFRAIYRAPKPSIRVKTALLTLAWIATTALLLALLYRWDRGGWLWFQATGYDVAIEENYHDLVETPIALFLQQAPIFQKAPNDSNAIILPAGTHDIEHTVVVPQGSTLIIEPGATLRFAASVSLISYSPIVARGTEEAPIVFTSQDLWRKWGSVGVVSEQHSVFKHTVFENGRRAHVNGVDFWGALSLIGAEVEIAHSRFRNLHGKDGVNVNNGQVAIYNNLFQDCHKDGLDLDGGSGEVFDNLFVDCDDEGIDVSENFDLRIFANTILDVRGGCLGADHNYEEIVAANQFGYSDKAPPKKRSAKQESSEL